MTGATAVTDVIRTPDERFVGLSDWDLEPRYSDVSAGGLDLRLAHHELGDGDETVVCLHGEPTWGYLWRHVAAPLAAADVRVVLPDLVGFGRSDKPRSREWFTYDHLMDALSAHLDAINLPERFTLVVHDWGGVLGLVWAVEHAQRIERLVVMNTGLYAPGATPSDAWLAFRDYIAAADRMPVGKGVAGATATDVPPEVVAAYDAPFHEPAAQAGALTLPLLVPLDDDAPGAQRQWAALQALSDWQRPTLVLWGQDDPILGSRIGERFAARIPGCDGLETFSPASHFLQEDVGEQLGQRIATWLGP